MSMRQLVDADESIQRTALARLAELVDRSSGTEAERLAACIRDTGSLRPLVELVRHPTMHQDALRILGNLASSAVDPNAAETKRLLRNLDAFAIILPLIYSHSSATTVYALGSVQNMCAIKEYAEQMRDSGAEVRLRELMNGLGEFGNMASSGGQASHFARGCLANMEAVLSPDFVPDPRLLPLSPSHPAPSRSLLQSASDLPDTSLQPSRPSHQDVENVAPHHLPMPTPLPLPQLLAYTGSGESPITLGAVESGADLGVVRRTHPWPVDLERPPTPTCSVCYDQQINVALIPCYHAAFCYVCAIAIVDNHLQCPICRGGVSGIQRIYLS